MSGPRGFVTRVWNRLVTLRERRAAPSDLRFGQLVRDGEHTRRPVTVPHTRRPEHVAIIGKTGSGKSSLLRYFCEQDIRAGRGFVFFDLHGDAVDQIVALVAEEEKRRGTDLSGRLIIIDPADREASVGMNILAGGDVQAGFVQIAEIAQLLKDRWNLDTLGVRTEELLRCSLLVLRDNSLTLLELAPLLTRPALRFRWVARTRDPEARIYFQSRFNQLSEPMQGVYREAVLNKLTAFSGDPHFRHLLGQARSTIDLRVAVDHGFWVVLNLDKGKLGDQAATLGALLLSRIKHTLFARESRRLLTLYCDELQNLVAFDGGLQSLLAEARKLGVSVTTANQYLDQYPAAMRSAVLSVGTLAFFQLAASDADRIARTLGGGRHLREQLRNLPKRELVMKTGSEPHQHVVVPDLPRPAADSRGLRRRCTRRWARARAAVEGEIAARLREDGPYVGSLDGWD